MLQTAVQARHIQAPPSAWSGANTAKPLAARPYETQLKIKSGSTIFHEGDDTTYFYKVTSGSLRLIKIIGDGHRQICDFSLAGDLVGFTNSDVHEFTAEALQDCTLVRYRRKDLDAIIRTDPVFACELQSLTMKGLTGAYAHMVRLCHRSAHDRLALFLLSMSDRAHNDDGWVELPMSRVDIADYLGMAHETVSRNFTKLKKSRAIIEASLNRIKLVNRYALEDSLQNA